MSKVTVPTKCAKCGSEQIRHEELTMYGRYGYGHLLLFLDNKGGIVSLCEKSYLKNC